MVINNTGYYIQQTHFHHIPFYDVEEKQIVMK